MKHKYAKKTSQKGNLKIRVIAGRIKGKSIECPPGEIRPMTSKVKEALFNIIGDVTDMQMLDLFTGSGNISIEAFSRGLENCDLIEADPGKRDIIKKNLQKTGFESANLMITDALLYCKRCRKKYDFIMIDPPFKWDKKEELIKIISENNLLNENGFLVIHLPKKENLPDIIGNFKNYDIRKYGLNMLLFYRKEL